MFYTGLSRTGPALAQKIINSLDSKTDNLRRMQSMVETARDLLSGAGDLDDFGHMLDEAWRLKRSLADQISNPRIDGYYEAALQAGALGGKLLGAGSSGFLLFYVPPDRQDAVRATMAPLLEIPFGFDTEGSVLLNSNLQ